jgi:hypothetical protein
VKTLARHSGCAAAILAACACAAGTPALAQSGSGSYGATFLKIPVGARLVASPGVVSGTRPDASLLYSNPAFLSGVENAAVFASSSQWLEDFSFNSIGTAIPLGEHTVLGAGATLLYSGGLTGYDGSLNAVGEENFYDLGVDVAVAHRFGSSGLSAAVGATYIREHLVPQDGSGMAWSAGASWWIGPNLLHAAARDLGGSVRYGSDSWDIAPEWTAGAARVFQSGVGNFFAGMEAVSSDAYGTRLRLGVDYAVHGMFTLRTGLNENLDDAQEDSHVSAGLGMNYGAFAIDYAYTPQPYFASTHTFTLAYSFGRHSAPAGPGPIVPPGDLAPSPPAHGEDGEAAEKPQDGSILLVAGAHATRDGARAEAHTLRMLDVPAAVESEGPRYRVVVGRFARFEDAARARDRYRAKGHDFRIVSR